MSYRLHFMLTEPAGSQTARESADIRPTFGIDRGWTLLFQLSVLFSISCADRGKQEDRMASISAITMSFRNPKCELCPPVLTKGWCLQLSWSLKSGASFDVGDRLCPRPEPDPKAKSHHRSSNAPAVVDLTDEVHTIKI